MSVPSVDDATTPATVGERARTRRLAEGLSLRQVVERSEREGYRGISPASVSRIENNKTRPQLYTVQALAAGLGTTVAALLED